jgi:Domain of unknown function (DUF6429)
MADDTDKIDEAVLGLLWLSLHNDRRAWKSFDWDATNRLFERRLIDDPRGKSKSVLFSDEGLAAAKAAYEKLFEKPSPAAVKPPSRRK